MSNILVLLDTLNDLAIVGLATLVNFLVMYTTSQSLSDERSEVLSRSRGAVIPMRLWEVFAD